MENIRIVSSYCHIPVIVFVNLKSFLSSKALEEVRQMASRYQVALLLLEPRERVELQAENRIIIDRDLCIL